MTVVGWLGTIGNHEEWTEQALCSQTDAESFFPERGHATWDAKRICKLCPVQVQCLDYAMRHDERFGVWGGLSEGERRKLRRGEITPEQAMTPRTHCWRNHELAAVGVSKTGQCSECHRIASRKSTALRLLREVK